MFHMERIPLRRTSVAAEVRAEIARQQISQTKVAEATGITTATLRRRLEGVRPFTVDELDRITTFLAVPLVSLIERAEANRG